MPAQLPTPLTPAAEAIGVNQDVVHIPPVSEIEGEKGKGILGRGCILRRCRPLGLGQTTLVC